MKQPGNPSQRIACLLFLTRPPEPDCEPLLAALSAHSPAVEPDGAACYLDAYPAGDEPLWSRTVLQAAWTGAGIRARLGLASTKFAAWVAAQTAPPDPGYQLVAEPDRAFLAPLPIHWLPLPAEAERRLHLLGLRTIGQFAALRERQVAEQLGPESLLAHRWARGLDERPVLGRAPRVLEAHHEFEVPEARHEALLEVAFRLLGCALQGLPAPREAWAIQRISLTAILDNGTVRQASAWLGSIPAPRAVRALLSGLLAQLKGSGAGIGELGLRLSGWEPAAGRQLALFACSETHARLEQALEQLAQKHTPACVTQANPLDTGAPLPAERYCLMEYRR